MVMECLEENLFLALQQVQKEGRESSPTFRFWDDFLSNVTIPFKMPLAATRSGQWEIYEESKLELLPLLFASNRTNYARYMPVLLLMMKRLPEEVRAAFEEGLFVAKLTDEKFNTVWMDYNSKQII